MSYELDSPTVHGSGVARNGKTYTVDTRGAGTATASRARRVAVGVSGYGNLSGHEDGLGFSLLNIVKPIASFLPGGNFITGGINLAQGAAQSTNAKDPERLATAQSNLQKALAGDANAYLLLQQQAGLIPGYGSATQYGKDVAKAALTAYANAKGAGTAPVAPVLMSPVIAPAQTPATAPATFDTSAPRMNVADMGGGMGGGISPALLLGVGIVAAMALKGRR